MMILPTAAEADGARRAREMLGEVVNRQTQVILFVFGDDDAAKEIAARADVRAGGHPARLAVWVKNPSVLQGDARFAAVVEMANDGVAAAAMTLDFQVAVRLAGDRAMDPTELGLAFARAQQGVPA